MLKIKAEEFARLLKSVRKTKIEELVHSIKELKCKLENIDAQTWYFRKATDSKKKRLDNLLKQYNQLRNIINNKSIGEIDVKIGRSEEEIMKRKSLYGFVAAIGTNIIKSEYYYWHTIREAKSRYGKLPCLSEIIMVES